MRVLDLDPFATFLPLTISQVDTDLRWRLHARAENILPINKEMMTLDMRTVTILKTNVDTKKTLHDVEITLAIGFGIWLSGANDSTVNSFELERILPYSDRYCSKFLNLSRRLAHFFEKSHLKDKVWLQL